MAQSESVNCPKGHGSMRASSLGAEWKLKEVESKVYVCDKYHGIWVENSEDASKQTWKKIRSHYYAGGSGYQ